MVVSEHQRGLWGVRECGGERARERTVGGIREYGGEQAQERTVKGKRVWW